MSVNGLGTSDLDARSLSSGGLRDSLRNIWILIRLQSRLLLRPSPDKASGRFGSSRASVLIRYAVLAFVVVFLAVGLGALMGLVLRNVDVSAFLPLLLSALSTAGMISVFMLALPMVLAVFTYNSDLRLLLLTPMSPRLIIAEKFLSMYVAVGLPVLVLGLVAVGAAGVALQAGIVYWIVAVISLLLLPVIPLGLAMLIVVTALRWIPPARARTITAVFGGLFGIIYFVGVQVFSRQERGPDITGALSQANTGLWGNLPTGWPGQAIATFGLGQTGAGLVYLILTALLSAALGGAAVLLSARLFATGWATYQEAGRRRRGSARPGPTRAKPVSSTTTTISTTAAPARRLPVWWPLVGKEWRTLRRDPQLWARLLYPLFIVAFGVYSSFQGTSGFGGPFSGNIRFYVTLTFSVYFLGVAFALSLINREGKALYLMALSPLSAREILFAKWTFAVIPALIVVEVLNVIYAIVARTPLPEVLFTMFVFAAMVISASGASLFVTLLWPRLDWTNPKQQVSGMANLVGGLGGLIFVGCICALMILAVVFGKDNPLMIALPVGAIVVICALVSGTVALAAPSRLEEILSGSR